MSTGELSNRPIRILQVVGGMDRAGVETWLMHVLRQIDRDRFRMDFLVHTDHPCAYDEEVRSLGSKIIPCLRPSRPWTYAHNFTLILRDYGPYDVVHSHVHHFSGYVVRLAHRAGIPLRISHSHNNTTNLETRSGMIRHAYLTLMKHWIERHTSLGISCSQEAEIALFGSRPEAKPRRRVLHYGIDLALFRPLPDSDYIRSELGIPLDAFVIGHVGRFHRQKNHAFLIDIFSEVVKLEPKACLLLMGKGELRPEIEKRVADAGLSRQVHFLGSRPDVPRLMMAAMDVFLFPSLYEGLPVVLLETQAAGLLSVVSNVISEETDLFHSLVVRLPLSQTPDFWAERILACRAHAGLGTLPDYAALMEGGDFDIRRSLSELVDLYGSYTTPTDPSCGKAVR